MAVITATKASCRPGAYFSNQLPSNILCGKIFTRILQHRWQGFMLRNNYMDRNIQKAFLPSTPGCTEHHSKLVGVLSEARHHHKSLTICWLHLANVYGSVHHSLICFALNLYHAPPKFKNIVSVLHSELDQPPLCHSKLVSTKETHCQSLSSTQSSIYLLQTRRDLGYSLSNSRHKVSLFVTVC